MGRPYFIIIHPLLDQELKHAHNAQSPDKIRSHS